MYLFYFLFLLLSETLSGSHEPSFSVCQLEALIRLTQARARIDFSNQASKQHVLDVISLIRHSMADTSVGDYVDINPGNFAASSQGSQVKKFLRMLQMRSSALGRNIFEFDEIKDMARQIGIQCGVSNLVNIVNMQGFLLKKGPNLYEIIAD